jgi:hypothetical protein
MKIESTGPGGSALTMDVPDTLLEVFKETHLNGEIERILTSLSEKFYSAVILALINDGKALAAEDTSTEKNAESEEGPTILLRLHRHIDAFTQSEIPGMNSRSRGH